MLNFFRSIYKEWGLGLMAFPMSMALIAVSMTLARVGRPTVHLTAALALAALFSTLKMRTGDKKWTILFGVLAAVFFCIMVRTALFAPRVASFLFMQWNAVYFSYIVLRSKPDANKSVPPPVSIKPFSPEDGQILFCVCTIVGSFFELKLHAELAPELRWIAAVIGISQIAYVVQRARCWAIFWTIVGASIAFIAGSAITGQASKDFLVWSVFMTAFFAGFEYRFRSTLDAQRTTDPYNVLGQQ